jgi:hypothetical protein
MARARIELMLRHASSGGGSASRKAEDEGSGRTGRIRVLSAFRDQLLSGVWTVPRWVEEGR